MTETSENGASKTDLSTANSPTQNPTGNGKPELAKLNSQEQATKTAEVLDEFETSSGLGIYNLSEEVESEADRLLNLTKDEIRQMTEAECCEAAFTLEQFAFHLQRGINRQQSQANWAESRVSRLISPTIHQMPAYSPAERRMLAIHRDDAAQKTEAIRMSSQLKLDRLSYLPGRVASLAKQLGSIAYAKKVRQ